MMAATGGDFVYDLYGLNAEFGYLIDQASFVRVPDEGGVRFWIDVPDQPDQQSWSNVDTQQFLAGQFIASDEFAFLFGENPTNEESIDAMNLNVLSRLPDPGWL